MRENVPTAKRLVIKVGTRVLTESDNTLSLEVVRKIAAHSSNLIDEGKEVVIVSSGAIALGLNRMGLASRPKEINLLQAAAALGQSHLMQAYETAFRTTGRETAQILLTLEDIQKRDRYLNIRNTLLTLWEFRTVPVVNENDTVSFSEITFGDNDILAAHLANMIDADLLLILSDIGGLYDRDPRKTRQAELIAEVPRIDAQLFRSARGKGSAVSSGGMESKLKAAQIATRGGSGVIIAGGGETPLDRLLAGEEIGTYFLPAPRRIRGKKKWIAFNPKVEGSIVIDSGGERAIIQRRKSLLPAGITEVHGRFKMGSNVSIRNQRNEEIARGLTNFSSDELERIKGLRTDKIPQVLGTGSYFEEAVHRDNMAIVPDGSEQNGPEKIV